MGLLIKNGEIVTGDSHYTADIWCENETVTRIDRKIDPPGGAEVIDASGKYVFPGFIDPHMHIYLPFMGTFSKDNYETGTKAALVGGTTTIIDMCCPSRTMEASEGFETWRAQADGKSACDYSLSHGRDEIRRWLRRATPQDRGRGHQSFKIFLAYKGAFGIDDAELYRTLKLAKELGVIVDRALRKRNSYRRAQKRTPGRKVSQARRAITKAVRRASKPRACIIS